MTSNDTRSLGARLRPHIYEEGFRDGADVGKVDLAIEKGINELLKERIEELEAENKTIYERAHMLEAEVARLKNTPAYIDKRQAQRGSSWEDHHEQ